MFGKVSGVSIALIVLVAVISASTVSTLGIFDNSQSDDRFVAKVDFSEGTNHYTLIEIDEGDNN